ncbi:MAG: PDZ domain-containing protein, partial [Planctomycetota bacterium]
FRLIVLAAPPHTHAMVQRPGETEPVKVAVNPRGKPVRIGISWKQDVADPSMVIVTRVIPGSAADQAGLRVSDRVYAVDGQRFANSKAFGNLMTRRPGPLRLKVERNGIIEHITVRPLQPSDDSAAVETTTGGHITGLMYFRRLDSSGCRATRRKLSSRWSDSRRTKPSATGINRLPARQVA